MTQITPLDFRDNLLGAFRTFWNNRTLVAWPNVEFKPEDVPEDEDAWVEVQIIGASPGQTSIGDSVNSGRNFQRTGPSRWPSTCAATPPPTWPTSWPTP